MKRKIYFNHTFWSFIYSMNARLLVRCSQFLCAKFNCISVLNRTFPRAPLVAMITSCGFFFINTTKNFSPGCHKLSPYWHTLHKTSNTLKDRKIQRYAGWRQPGMSFISLLYSPFTLCVFLASIPPERHDLKPYPQCCFRCDSLFHVTALCMKS